MNNTVKFDALSLDTTRFGVNMSYHNDGGYLGMVAREYRTRAMLAVELFGQCQSALEAYEWVKDAERLHHYEDVRLMWDAVDLSYHLREEGHYEEAKEVLNTL